MSAPLAASAFGFGQDRGHDDDARVAERDVVVVEHVAGGAVDPRGGGRRHALGAEVQARLGRPAERGERVAQSLHRGLAAARDHHGNAVADAELGERNRCRRQLLETQLRGEFTQLLRERLFVKTPP
jgi:hypothetical protein